MLSAHPEIDLTGAWARRLEAADAIARSNGTTPYRDLDALFESCDAVVFAVPPNVQADLATRAARAGKALLLEKPIALTLEAASRLAEIVDDSGVNSQIALTWRYAQPVREGLTHVAQLDALGATARFVHGGLRNGPFATPWRLEHGPLPDLGPHVIDLLDAAFGPVAAVAAVGDLRRWVAITLRHTGGLVSQAVLSGHVAEAGQAGLTVYAEEGLYELDTMAAAGEESFATLFDEFVRTARGMPHALDVHRGLEVQRVLDSALGSLQADGATIRLPDAN